MTSPGEWVRYSTPGRRRSRVRRGVPAGVFADDGPPRRLTRYLIVRLFTTRLTPVVSARCAGVGLVGLGLHRPGEGDDAVLRVHDDRLVVRQLLLHQPRVDRGRNRRIGDGLLGLVPHLLRLGGLLLRLGLHLVGGVGMTAGGRRLDLELADDFLDAGSGLGQPDRLVLLGGAVDRAGSVTTLSLVSTSIFRPPTCVSARNFVLTAVVISASVSTVAVFWAVVFVLSFLLAWWTGPPLLPQSSIRPLRRRRRRSSFSTLAVSFSSTHVSAQVHGCQSIFRACRERMSPRGRAYSLDNLGERPDHA